MRIARFVHPGGAAFGVVEGGAHDDPLTFNDEGQAGLAVAEIEGHPFGDIQLTGKRWPLNKVRLLSPILPSKVVGIGRNYVEHAVEMSAEVAKTPLIFLKPSTSVIGPLDAIRIPDDAGRVDHEAELAVIIGARGARNVSPEQALTRVFGYTCGNDVTARDEQRLDGQWARAKGHDSFCPLGPWIETDFVPGNQEIRCEVDGELRQSGKLSDMQHDVATIVSHVSHVMTLLPGDVILTGTPAGIAPLNPGQSVSVHINGIGTLTNPVLSLER